MCKTDGNAHIFPVNKPNKAQQPIKKLSTLNQQPSTSIQSGASVAFFILLAAATWTRVIPANFLVVDHSLWAG